MIAMNNLDN